MQGVGYLAQVKALEFDLERAEAALQQGSWATVPSLKFGRKIHGMVHLECSHPIPEPPPFSTPIMITSDILSNWRVNVASVTSKAGNSVSKTKLN